MVPATPERRLTWLPWVLVPLLVMVFGLSTLVALIAWGEATDDCNLRMEFERTSSDVLEQRAFPPRQVCRYLYESGVDGEAIYPPEVVVTRTQLRPW
mgnify:CR=1 FL=1